MAITLPLPPTNSPVFDKNGIMTEPWRRYFLSLENLGPDIPPIDARYLVGTANSALTDEINLGALASGYLKITTAAGQATPSTVTSIPAADIAAGGTFNAINGSNLSNLNASNLASGTVADGRLSSNVPLKNGSNTFTSLNVFPAGAGTSTVVPSGRVASLTGAVTTTGTVEEVLFTYTMPANTLNVNGQAMRISGTYTTAANANVKALNVRVGGITGTIITAFSAATNNGNVWFDAILTRRTSGTAYGSGFASSGTATTTTAAAATPTLTGNVDLVVTGTTVTAAGDMTLQNCVVEYLG